MDLVGNVVTNLAAAAVIALGGYLIGRNWGRAPITILRLGSHGIRAGGLVGSYATMKHARRAIAKAVRASKSVSTLGIRGGDLFSGDQGLLIEALTNPTPHPVVLRTLLLSPYAPWVSQELAATRSKSSLHAMRHEMAASHSTVTAAHAALPLREQSEVRYYTSNPAWRLIITDKSVFVSSYAAEGQARAASVEEYSVGSPFYEAWSRHFASIWNTQSVPVSTISDFDSGVPVETSRASPDEEVELSAGLAIISRIKGKRRVLMLERKDGSLTLPKGHVEMGESVEDAAVREAREEVGIDVKDLTAPRALGWWPSYLSFAGGGQSLKIIFYYIVQTSAPESARAGSAEHRAVRWIDIEQIDQLSIAYPHVAEVLGAVQLSADYIEMV